MAEQNATGEDCLLAVTSLYLYHHLHPEKLPGGPRLVFALALALTRVVSRKKAGIEWREDQLGKDKKVQRQACRQFKYRNFPTTASREMGENILGNLGRFLMNAATAIAAEEDALQQGKRDLAMGFDVAAPAPPASPPSASPTTN